MNLYTEFSIHEAALLLAGHDPEDFVEVPESHLPRLASNYCRTRDAITRAVETGRLEAARSEWLDNGFGSRSTLCIYGTLIAVENLDAFATGAGNPCPAFSRQRNLSARMDAACPTYPPKLDAANKAWAAVTSDPTLLRGKSPKQAMTKWLTDNAAECGLINKHGKLNQTGIREICKVANWKPSGGATPTPAAPDPAPARENGYGFAPTPARSAPPTSTGRRQSFDLDDELPF